MFEALGLTDTEEAVYVALLTGRGSTADEVAGQIGVGDEPARVAVARLKDLGFVTHRPGSPARLTPVPPDLAVSALAARRRHELGEAERTALHLAAQFPA